MAEPYSGPEVGAIRASLAGLVAEGLVPYNVADNGSELLSLQIVMDRVAAGPDASEAEQEAAVARALVDVLTDALNWEGGTARVRNRYRRLLRYVLPLDEDYLSKSLKERRTAAGLHLKDGSKTVKAGTIRTYHEPRAIIQLARVLVVMEAEHRRQAVPGFDS